MIRPKEDDYEGLMSILDRKNKYIDDLEKYCDHLEKEYSDMVVALFIALQEAGAKMEK